MMNCKCLEGYAGYVSQLVNWSGLSRYFWRKEQDILKYGRAKEISDNHVLRPKKEVEHLGGVWNIICLVKNINYAL